MQTISLTQLGTPIGKARPRFYNDKAGHIRSYKTDPTAHASNSWRDLFVQSGQAPFPPDAALVLTVAAYFPRPPSAPKRRVRPTVKPDYNNIANLITDALQHLAFHDDSQIVDAHVHKHYATFPDPPRTEITITEAA